MTKTRRGRSGNIAAEAAAGGTAGRGRWWLAVALLAAVAAYLSSFKVPYLYDDHDAVENNPGLETPWSFRWLYEVPENSTLMARPALSWSFGINSMLLGHSPVSYHAVNLAIHLVNVALLYLLVARGLGRTGWAGGRERCAAAGAALLWGVHPLNVQAVTYMVQRGESLATLFVMLTLLAYLKSGEAGRSGWRAVALACPALAVATKEIGWIAPVLPLIWKWIFDGVPPAREMARHPLFYACGLGAWALLAALTLTGGRTVQIGHEPGVNAWTYFLTQPEVITRYLRLFFVPVGQSFDYDWPLSTVPRALPWMALWGGLFLAACLAVWKRRAVGMPAMAGFLFLSASSSFVALLDTAVEYRFYAAGACCAAIVGSWLFVRFRRHTAHIAVMVACAALVLGTLTYRRGVLFQKEWNVWAEAVKRNPAERRALSNLAGFSLAWNRPREALDYLREVERLGVPNRMRTRVYFQMGNALLDLGNAREAADCYGRSLRTASGNAGPVFMNLGHAYLRLSRWAEARIAFESALKTMSAGADLRFDLAYVCLEGGDVPSAMAYYEAGVRMDGRPQPALTRRIRNAGVTAKGPPSAAP
jgi:hypothetical protein